MAEPQPIIEALRAVELQPITVTLTPATFSMPILARTREAIYVRLPRELWRVALPGCGNCNCDGCKGLTPGYWDTLVIPTQEVRHKDWTHTVHMPDATVQAFKDYMRRKEAKATPDAT